MFICWCYSILFLFIYLLPPRLFVFFKAKLTEKLLNNCFCKIQWNRCIWATEETIRFCW